MKLLLPVFIMLCISVQSIGQNLEMSYYFPNESFDSSIPTPESVLGYVPGEWHASHDKLIMYYKALDKASEKVTLQEYAYSYEGRPLMVLTITSEKNHQNLDEIRREHLLLSDNAKSAKIEINNMPVVVYMGYSIHGNEPSGGNAALLAAYWLAASTSDEVANYLENAVILLDPCYNPDGFNRFSTWANMHKNDNLTSDPNDREYREAWPRGRTNHYWFDLNRDWLLLSHPESRGRVETFHSWKPNVLTDHHEMGTNSTFFFQPGVPSRVNENTPQMNQTLTARIGTFHAAELDKIGSLYYSAEGFDDFYYGKGSTYPDANGGVGILFEQASSRGHLQESDNGTLSFPFTIRNQLTTTISTIKASVHLKNDLLNYQRQFYKDAVKIANQNQVKGYIFNAGKDKNRINAFIDIAMRHQINVYELEKDHGDFRASNSYIIPVDQHQVRLIKTLFEDVTTFQDSLFYDVSAWTFPHAFDLNYKGLDEREYNKNILGALLQDIPATNAELIGTEEAYAYLMEWDDYLSPAALYEIQKHNIRTKVATDLFDADINGKRQKFARGTILIPIQNQNVSQDEMRSVLTGIAKKMGIPIYATGGGDAIAGKDLGSSTFRPLDKPKIALVVGDGASSYDAGEIWHLMDQRYDIDISKIASSSIGRIDLSRYNTIIVPDGSYSGPMGKAIKPWVQNGGKLIVFKRAISWANNNGLANNKARKMPKDKRSKSQYANARNEGGAKVIGGTFFQNEMDLTHPLSYGYSDEKIAIFKRGSTAYDPAGNIYATPLRYVEKNPLLSGYVHKSQLETLSGSAGIIVYAVGSGRVMTFTDNPNFRAYTYGSNKLFANALFFGSIISSSTCERVPAKKD